MKPLKRFTDRIGKTIYRDAVSCDCQSCKDGGDHGIQVRNKMHAQYLHSVHCDMQIEYRDTKEPDGLQQVKDLFGMK